MHGDLIFAPSRERPLLALKPGGRGDVTGSHVLWSFNNGPDVPTPVTDGTYLYSINDRGIMYCLDAKTGQDRLRTAAAAQRHLQRLAGARRRQDLHHRRGRRDDASCRPGPKFALLAENDLGDYTLSSPAVSDGQIFVRTASFLYAIGQRRTTPK